MLQDWPGKKKKKSCSLSDECIFLYFTSQFNYNNQSFFFFFFFFFFFLVNFQTLVSFTKILKTEVKDQRKHFDEK